MQFISLFWPNHLPKRIEKFRKRFDHHWIIEMSDEGIRVPTWALPAFLAVLSGAVVWGASEARAQATQEEVDRIEAVVEKTVAEAQATGKLAAVNATKIEAIVDSLAEQAETAKASDQKLQQLIEIMLKNQN